MIPKVLVISNECFSKISSNGRTLGNFFLGWPKNCLAQFYLSGIPDYDYCCRYFQVSDRQVLNSLLGKKRIEGEMFEKTMEDSSGNLEEVSGKKVPRNALTMLGRNAVWMTGAWKKSGYWKWVEEYSPDVIILQAGDCAFMYKIAFETAKKKKAKLVIYNSESYYYKDFDYFRGTGLAHALYPIFRIQLCKALKKAYSIADCGIYICDELKEVYSKDFSGRAETIFTGSDVQYEEKQIQNEKFTTVYCGNLGLKRHESLIDIANELQSIDKTLFVDVYGKVPDKEVMNELNRCRGVRYHGLIPYEEVRRMLRDSDLILYVESFDSFYQEDIKFGFSTKIADSLSCGNCFLLYAPEHLACFQYLKKNQAAYTVSSKQELKLVLKELIENPKARSKYRETALHLAEKNHRIEHSKERFQKIIRELVE